MKQITEARKETANVVNLSIGSHNFFLKGNRFLHKGYELQPNESILIFHAIDETLQKLGLFEETSGVAHERFRLLIFPRKKLLFPKFTLEKYSSQQIQQVNLFRVVFRINCLPQSSNKGQRN